MTVLVDTPVWSFAYRRAKRTNGQEAVVAALTGLIRINEAVLIGSIRQEVLSGISSAELFDNVRWTLRGFETLDVLLEDHERAAEFFNECRRRGVQGSPTDFLICAVGVRLDAPVFSTDRDFNRYAKIVGVKLFKPN